MFTANIFPCTKFSRWYLIETKLTQLQILSLIRQVEKIVVYHLSKNAEIVQNDIDEILTKE